MIKDAGWHFSFLKKPESIIRKIKSYSHQEFNSSKFTDKKGIEDKIAKGEDLFEREIKYNVVDLDETFPDYIFKNKDKLTILENYLHPKVLLALQEIIQNTEDELFVEVSAPKNIYKDFDCIVIYSQVETRIKRLQERGMNYEDIQNRIANQKDDDWWKNLGIVIQNDNLNVLHLNLDNIINQNS